MCIDKGSTCRKENDLSGANSHIQAHRGWCTYTECELTGLKWEIIVIEARMPFSPKRKVHSLSKEIKKKHAVKTRVNQLTQMFNDFHR
jgi:hypothetical protein